MRVKGKVTTRTCVDARGGRGGESARAPAVDLKKIDIYAPTPLHELRCGRNRMT